MTIRDFLYLDFDLVRSFSAQVFEGVTESIVDEVRVSHDQTSSPKPRKDQDNIVAEIAKASLRSENRVLHDHLFTLLETRLANTIVNLKRS